MPFDLSFEGTHSIETTLQTYELMNWPDTSKLVSMECVPSNGQKKITFANGNNFSYLQMDIFCHFDMKWLPVRLIKFKLIKPKLKPESVLH